MLRICAFYFFRRVVEMLCVSFGHKSHPSSAKDSRNTSVNVYSRLVVLVLMYFIPFSLFMKLVTIFLKGIRVFGLR